MVAKLFLGASALIWLPYGLFCFASPGFLADAAGVGALSATGTTELRAMYGGLQAAIGAMALAALLRPALVAPALWMLGALATGLASARLIGAALDGAWTSYTFGGLAFEIPTLAVAWALLRPHGRGQ